MRARLTSFYHLALCAVLSAIALPATARESNAADDSPIMPPAIVISGGTDAERRLVDNFLLHQLSGLASSAHPLAITIIPDDEMRKLVLSGNGDAAPNPNDTLQTIAPAASQPNSTESAPNNNNAATSQNSDPDDEVDAIYTEADTSVAPTNTNANRAEITLLKGEDTDDFSEAFLHEFGHHLWFTVASPLEISDFKVLYAQATRAQTFVSDYAAVSAEEDFAESFAYYELKPKLLAKRDPAAAQYMTQLLGRLHTSEANATAPNIQIVQGAHDSVDDSP